MRMLAKMLLLLLGIAVLGGGWVTFEQGSVIREKNRLIARNDFVVDSLRVEKRNLQRSVDELAREMAALPDSVRLMRTGDAVRASNRIAKQDLIYDTRITRNRNMERSRREARDEALRRLLLWDGAIVAGILVLGVSYVLLRKRGA